MQTPRYIYGIGIYLKDRGIIVTDVFDNAYPGNLSLNEIHLTEVLVRNASKNCIWVQL